MAKRHNIKEGDWELIMGRLEELVLANSGEDEFEEIFKLLVAKLYSEINGTNDSSFRTQETAALTATHINSLMLAASNRWKGIIEGNPISMLTHEHLHVCVKELEPFSLKDSNLEVMDALFEYLVSKSKKGSKGQYFTPRHVIDCCVKILNPSPREYIVDPACGSGGFLIHTLNHNKTAAGFNMDSYCKEYLWGFDFDMRAVKVAKTLMLLAGDGNTNIFRLNSLLQPQMTHSLLKDEFVDNAPCLTIEDVTRLKLKNFKGFDCILTNPPFAGEIHEENILTSYKLSRNSKVAERDALFLERCVNLLKPGGRMAIILPTNKFGSATWSFLRSWLLKKVRVVGVLGLGRNTFLPHTHQKTSILFCQKRHAPSADFSNEKILFVVSEKDGKDSKGKTIIRDNTETSAWLRLEHDLFQAVDMFHSFFRTENINWGE